MRGSRIVPPHPKRTSLPATLNATADFIFANAVTGPSGNGGMKLANVRVSGDLWPILYATASRDDVVVSYLCALVSLMRVLSNRTSFGLDSFTSRRDGISRLRVARSMALS